MEQANAMPPVAKDLGCDLDICSIYIPGCPLKKYWANVCTATNMAQQAVH